MLEYLTTNLVAIVSALGGPIFTVAAAASFATWTISRRVASSTAQSARIKHEETTVAEANRHSEKLLLIKSNDPKLVEGTNKQLASD